MLPTTSCQNATGGILFFRDDYHRFAYRKTENAGKILFCCKLTSFEPTQSHRRVNKHGLNYLWSVNKWASNDASSNMYREMNNCIWAVFLNVTSWKLPHTFNVIFPYQNVADLSSRKKSLQSWRRYNFFRKLHLISCLIPNVWKVWRLSWNWAGSISQRSTTFRGRYLK